MLNVNRMPRELACTTFLATTPLFSSALFMAALGGGQSIAVPFEFKPQLGKPVLIEAPNFVPKKAFSRKNMPRAVGFVPTDPAAPLTLLSFRTPQNSNTTIDAIAMDLFPSQLNEENYVWSLLVNGTDQFGNNSAPIGGRPIRSNSLLPVNYTPEEKIIVEGGSLVEVVVRPVFALPASDRVSVLLSCTIWGIF